MIARRLKFIELPNSPSGNYGISVESTVEAVLIHHGYILGTLPSPPTLSGDMSITASGTPESGQQIFIAWMAGVELNGHTLTIFGKNITERQAASNFILHALYEKGDIYPSGAWIVQILVDFGTTNTKIIGNDEVEILVDDVTIEDDPVNGLQVKDGGISLAKLEALTEAYMIIGGTGGTLAAKAISGDVTITKDGVVSIGSDKIVTAKILDKNITLDKIQDVTYGSLIIGNSSNRPVLYAVGAGKIIIGSAAGIVAVTPSGDVTISEAGVMSIAANAITTSKILNAAVTLDKLENLASGKIIIGNASNRPTAVIMSGDAEISNAGVVTIKTDSITTEKVTDSIITPSKLVSKDMTSYKEIPAAIRVIESTTVKALLDGSVNDLCDFAIGEKVIMAVFITQTPAGTAGTIDIGVDASARQAGADGDGIIKVANANSKEFYTSLNASYRGALMDFGWFEADGTGKITIKSSVDLSSSSWIGSVIIYYSVA